MNKGLPMTRRKLLSMIGYAAGASVMYQSMTSLGYAAESPYRGLNVKLEPFLEMNFNSYLHAKNAFGGKPQRYRDVISDFRGGVSELLAKAVNTDKLDMPVTDEDKEMLLAP